MWTQVWPPKLLTVLWDSSNTGPKPLGNRRINASRQSWRDQIHPTFTEPSNPPLWHLTLIYNLGDDNKYSNQTLPLWLCSLSPLALEAVSCRRRSSASSALLMPSLPFPYMKIWNGKDDTIPMTIPQFQSNRRSEGRHLWEPELWSKWQWTSQCAALWGRHCN